MSVAEKVVALLEFLNEEQIQAEPPATRQRLAQLCRHVATIAEPSTRILGPKTGILNELRNGAPRHE